ncbi:MAG: hypothetical protein AAF460_11760 [Pseudomonadota bacterium]
MSADTDALGTALSNALASGDEAAVSAAYADIGTDLAARDEVDGACFFWTQALVFALSAGDTGRESDLRDRLSRHGRV